MDAKYKTLIRNYLLMAFGSLTIAIGTYFFKFPNHFSTGGIAGLVVILDRYIPTMSQGMLNTVLNIALLLLAILFFGRSFGVRTAFCTLLLTFAVQLFEIFIPMDTPMTTHPLLELIFAVGLPAIGSAILFHLDASSGGTDIIAMILKRYTSINIGNALFISDAFIAVASCFAFGMETGLFSILGLCLKSVIVDVVLDSFRMRKCVQVVTTNPDPVIAYIVNKLSRGATIHSVKGAYSNTEKYCILSVLSRSQALHLRRYLHATDPNSFIVITNSTEIIGKGFSDN